MSNYATYHTPLGDITIGYSELVVYSITLCESVDSGGIHTPFTDSVIGQITEYLKGHRTSFTFEWEMRGTEFQQRVWRELMAIPYGERRTYKDIAVAVGSPRAARGVGSACNRNPMLIVVPCHRVVGSNGRMVGYAAGVELKQWLLEMERVTSHALR